MKRKYIQRNGKRLGAFVTRGGRVFTYKPNDANGRERAKQKAAQIERIFSGR